MDFETNWMELELTLRFASFLHFLTRIEGAGYFRIVLVLFRNPVAWTFSSSWSYYSSPAAAHFPISAHQSQVWSYQSKPTWSEQMRKFPPWPFAVIIKQTVLFTQKDGILQHSEQTLIIQLFYPNLWSPDGRKQFSWQYLRENFVPWDITGQQYSPEHILRHMLYNNAS